MTTYKNIYAIGDVQGCYDELQKLLELIKFDPQADQLWFVGDLVNRGPQSLQVLRLTHSLGEHAITVLGNHDIHLLAVAAGTQQLKAEDTLNGILQAPDREQLLTWLSHRPLLHHDAVLGYTLVHAGIPPQWSLDEAIAYAHELETELQKNNTKFLQQIYGVEPSAWCNDLNGVERLRYITNALTRIRFCTHTGKLNLTFKGSAMSADANMLPWFSIPDRQTVNNKIIFGHWAMLHGKTNMPNVFALDTGCVWGNTLTAMRLHDNRIFSVRSQK